MALEQNVTQFQKSILAMRQNHSQLMEQYAREISKMRAQENVRVDKKAQEANAIENITAWRLPPTRYRSQSNCRNLKSESRSTR